MRAITMVAVGAMLAGSALAVDVAYGQGACQPAGPCQPCQSVPPCQPAQPCSPPQYVVRVPERIQLETARQQPHAETPQGMFVAPPQSGRVYGEGKSTIIRGLALHLPAITIGLPSLELPSVQRARDDAYMELNSARAPYVNMPTGPLRPMRAAPPLEEAQAEPCEAPAQEPPPPPAASRSSRACDNPNGAAREQRPAAAAPPPRPPASQVPGQPAAPPFPTPEETARQFQQLLEMERRIDAKMAYLAAVQRQLNAGAPTNSPSPTPAPPRYDANPAQPGAYGARSLIQPTALIEPSPRAEEISSSWQQANVARRLPAP